MRKDLQDAKIMRSGFDLLGRYIVKYAGLIIRLYLRD